MPMRQDGEASVEEILESIKKVIARDNRDTALAARRRREEVAQPIADEELVEEEEEVLDLSAADFAEEAEAHVDAEFDDERDSDELTEDDAPLITEAVRGSMRDNLAALAMLAEPGKPPQIVRSGETSLEELTRQLLRPMLAEWLDKNLPGMVERLVKAEIARIAGKRG